MRLNQLAALSLLFASLSFTLAHLASHPDYPHRLVVRKTRATSQQPEPRLFNLASAAENEAKEVVHGIAEGVHEFASRLELKHYSFVNAFLPSEHKLLNSFKVVNEDGKDRYKVLPSGGEFRLPITIGGKTYEPLADTGSSDIIIDVDVNYTGPPGGKTGKAFHAAYGGGQDVRGDIYLDSVTALGLTVDKLAVGKVTDGELIDNSLKPPPSGVFGLGFDGSSSFMIDSHDQRFEPFMVRAAKQGTLKKFAFDLTTNGGYIDVNSAVSMDGVAFCRIVGQSFWEITGSLNGHYITSIVDSGTDHILGPKDEVVKIFTAMGLKVITDDYGNVGADVDCKKGAPLTFQFGSAKVVMDGPTSATPREGGGCVSAMFGLDGGDQWVVGQPFFFSAYVVYDPVYRRIGIKSKEPAESGGSHNSTSGTPSKDGGSDTPSTTHNVTESPRCPGGGKHSSS